MANKVIISTEANKVTVTQTETDKRIVKVSAVGPRGEKGDPGAVSDTFTGRFNITGSLIVSGAGITGSLFGTASWAQNVALSNISGTTFNDTVYTFPNNVVIEGNLTAEQLIISSSVYYVTTSYSSGSTIFGNSIDDTHQFTGSVSISGGLIINNLDILELSIFRETGSFWATTNNIEITGSTSIKGNLIVDGLVSGSFYGDGDNIYFNRVGTNQNNNSNLVIGNWYNNYQYQQTTTFRNSNVIISGNLAIQSGSVLILGATTIAPTPVTGGIYYHLNDGFYVTEI